MFKYIWIIFIAILYVAWFIYAIHDICLSMKTQLPCEELTLAFFYTTFTALFVWSFITWIFSFSI